MSHRDVHTHVGRERAERGWSQAELARRAGLSRSEVSAVETGRVQPSVGVALALASALGRPVDTLFTHPERSLPTWAWEPVRGGGRWWMAQVGGVPMRFPVEPTAAGVLPWDGLAATRAPGSTGDPSRSLVLAGCDPAAALLVERVRRRTAFRVLPYVRASGPALDLLGAGLVHAAGLHLAPTSAGNADRVRERLGPGYRLLHVARWTEGLALAPGLGLDDVGKVVRARLRWVGREEGSGARQCLDAIFEGRPPVDGRNRVASDHRAVVEVVRAGWAQAGVCVRLAAEEARLDFLPVREEAYDLCFPARLAEDPGIRALAETVRSEAFRRDVAGLPGYDGRDTGALA